MLNINPYLERFIFDELKAQYDPDPIAALHNLDNNERTKSTVLRRLLSKKFLLSHIIFFIVYLIEEIYKNFIGKKENK